MFQPRFVTLTGMIFMAALSRLAPHPPNFTPIAAMALFGGAHFVDKRAAFLVPLGAMFLSDSLLGFHAGMPFVYGSFALIACIGLGLRRRRPVPIAVAALSGSVLFFLITNFGVWSLGSFYPNTREGLLACYAAAVPFFRNTLFGDAVYAAAFFSSFALAESRFQELREPSPQTARRLCGGLQNPGA